ncbi:RusA family crossover junction endodeoxyribonuclease [Patescibacteria group bacterium]|nr:RusA family crossover junction endodeoxyribonuclease [Patescibacteria group bacterium]
MIISSPTLEYLIIVPDKARSFRSRYAKTYREKVRECAKAVIKKMFYSDDINLKMDYFYRGNRNVDMDNVTKNVMDALTGLVYPDDKLVKDQSSRAHRIDKVTSIKREVFDIFKPLLHYKEYLAIRISSKSCFHRKQASKRTND